MELSLARNQKVVVQLRNGYKTSSKIVLAIKEIVAQFLAEMANDWLVQERR